MVLTLHQFSVGDNHMLLLGDDAAEMVHSDFQSAVTVQMASRTGQTLEVRLRKKTKGGFSLKINGQKFRIPSKNDNYLEEETNMDVWREQAGPSKVSKNENLKKRKDFERDENNGSNSSDLRIKEETKDRRKLSESGNQNDWKQISETPKPKKRIKKEKKKKKKKKGKKKIKELESKFQNLEISEEAKFISHRTDIFYEQQKLMESMPSQLKQDPRANAAICRFLENPSLTIKKTDLPSESAPEAQSIPIFEHHTANLLQDKINVNSPRNLDEIEKRLNDMNSKHGSKLEDIRRIIKHAREIKKIWRKQYQKVESIEHLKFQKKGRMIDTMCEQADMYITRQMHRIGNNIQKKSEKLIENSQYLMNLEVDNDLVARLYQASYLHIREENQKGYYLRDAQLVSLLSVLLKNPNRNRLIEVKTGEGKTLIVTILSAYKALQGLKVDIVTSSPVLAQEGASESKSFLQKLDISSGNIRQNMTDEIREKMYKCTVLYGTSHLFSVDMLRGSNELKDMRFGRKFEYLIVDEVDSMLLDNTNYRSILSEPTARSDFVDMVKEGIFYKMCILVEAEKRKGGDPRKKKRRILKEIRKTVDVVFNENLGKINPTELANVDRCYVDWVDNSWKTLFDVFKDEHYTIQRDKYGVEFNDFEKNI